MIVLGGEHEDTTTSMNDLALAYMNQGQWNKAEELGVRVVAISKRVHGDKRPGTLSSMANLARTWKSLGRKQEAISLTENCLQLEMQISSMDRFAAGYRFGVLNKWKKE